MPLAVGRDEQRDGAVGARGALHPGEEQQVVGDRPEGDHVLLAREVVRVALAGDAAAQVGAGAGGRLGQREGDLELATDHRLDEPLALLGGGVGVHRPPHAVAHMHDHPQRGVRHREQLEQRQVLREADAPPAVLDRGRKAQVAARVELLPEAVRNRAFALDPLGPRLPLGADVGADLLGQLRQLGGIDLRGRGDGGHQASLWTSVKVRARSRRTNFWILPDGVRGSSETSSSRSGQ